MCCCMGAAGQKDLGKCCHLFLGCGCALGKPDYCSSLGETRQGLGWCGCRGAGCWICAVGVALGWFPLHGLGVASQGSRALKTCFTRLHCRALVLSWCKEDCSDGKKGDMDPWQNCCASVVLGQKWQMSEAMLYRGSRDWGQTVPSCVWKVVMTAFQKVYVDACPWLLKEDKGFSWDQGVTYLSLCLLGINVSGLCWTLPWCCTV